MELNKVLGLDGFPAVFYQKFLDIIKGDLLCILNLIGLRQGDPITWASQWSSLSILQYADAMIIFMDNNLEKAHNMKNSDWKIIEEREEKILEQSKLIGKLETHIFGLFFFYPISNLALSVQIFPINLVWLLLLTSNLPFETKMVHTSTQIQCLFDILQNAHIQKVFEVLHFTYIVFHR
ncbi:hypothetical protein ACJX0J_039870, partial [Zea mays]